MAYNSKNSDAFIIKLAESEEVSNPDVISQDDIDTVFSGLVDTPLPELLKGLIEKGHKSPNSFPIKIKKEKNEHLANKFNSSKIASESTFDEEDWEQMHPDWANEFSPGEESSHEIVSFGGEDIEGGPRVETSGASEEDETEEYETKNRNQIDCPNCYGVSKHNKDKFAIYTEPHCKGCPTKNCGSDQNNVSPHCAGCELLNHGCKGRDRAYYEGDKDAECPVCHNEGTITKRDKHCLTCDDKKCKGPDPLAKGHGHCYGCKDQKAPNDYHLPEAPYSEIFNPGQHTVPEDDEFDDFERHEEDEDMSSGFGGEGAPVRKRDLSSAVVEKPRYEKQEESSRLDSPVSLSKSMRINEIAPKEQDAPKEDRYEVTEKNQPVPVLKAEKHNPWCKCGGSGIVSNPEEIAKINVSDEFKNGIANIKNTAKNDEEASNRKQQFILDQYKCKEM